MTNYRSKIDCWLPAVVMAGGVLSALPAAADGDWSTPAVLAAVPVALFDF